MTISRVNPSGWVYGDSITAAQVNALDAGATQALDKRADHPDTLQSIVSCFMTGRINPTYSLGVDANTTYAFGAGLGVIDASVGLTAARTYTLSSAGAAPGDKAVVIGGGFDVTVKDGVSSTTILVVGANTLLSQSSWGEFLWDGVNWVLLASSSDTKQQRQVFTSNGTYTTPSDCYKLLVIGAGGGGGGGGGGGNIVSTFAASVGGGGGGAAQITSTFVDTSPGATFAVTRGAAGSAGVIGIGAAVTGGGQIGGNGGDGGNTTFGSTLTFRGGGGGLGGYIEVIVPTSGTRGDYIFAPGGGPVAGGVRPAWTFPTNITVAQSPAFAQGMRIPGEGGYGISAHFATATRSADGMNSATQSLTAGTGTTTPGSGVLSAITFGGGVGGGGAASAFGNGGNGGAGGLTDKSSGSAGSAGGVAAGGGGGGGGATGSSVGGGNGGLGGAGGTGLCIVIPIR